MNVHGATTFCSTFANCKSINEVPKDLFKYNVNVTSFGSWWAGVFQGCTSLETVPEDLFKYNTEVTTFECAFLYCHSLKSLPDFSNNTKLTNVSWMFSGCNNLTGNADSLINNSNITSYTHCFSGCSKVDNYSQIPSGWK